VRRRERAQPAQKATDQRAHQPDYLLTVIVMALVAIGMIMLYATGSIVKLSITGGINGKNTFFTTQLISFILGIVVWYIVSKIRYDFWRKYSLYLFLGSFFLMLLVLVPGLAPPTNGASRWLRLGGLSVQPVEFFKLGLILYLATWLEKNKGSLGSFMSGLMPFLLILGSSAFLAVFVQRDMGSGMVLFTAGMSVLFMSSMPLWLYGSAFGVFAAGGALMIMTQPYRLARVMTFFNHKEDVSASGYHINQALIALGSGGILGKGLGNGLQSYGYLPESTNDSIFAILGEQFGLWGTSIVVGLFALLVYRGLSIVRRAPDDFSRLVAVGITAWFGFQAIINIAAMLNLIPLTGIPLPFISYGGTSMLASLVAIGILQNISKYTVKEATDAHRGVGGRNGGAYFADSSSPRRVKTTR
jgi:cell division protein FtsW